MVATFVDIAMFVKRKSIPCKCQDLVNRFKQGMINNVNRMKTEKERGKDINLSEEIRIKERQK